MNSKLVADFDWDKGECEKCQKHGVTMGKIESVLGSEEQGNGKPM